MAEYRNIILKNQTVLHILGSDPDLRKEREEVEEEVGCQQRESHQVLSGVRLCREF